MLGCGGGGEGLEIFLLVCSRARLGSGTPDSTVSEPDLVRFELDVASKGCRTTGLFEAARPSFAAGVADAALASPVVMRINSHCIPSSLYVSCIGLEGFEYRALMFVLVIPA